MNWNSKPEHAGKRNTSKSSNNQRPSNSPIRWTPKHAEILISHFVVHTDASQDGLGAVFYQKQSDVMRVIAYASRTLTPAKKKYHLHSGKLEFLALKWAVTGQFRNYLYYAPEFTVFTDSNPLTYVLTMTKLNSTGLRWVGELSDFYVNIKYRPGKSNTRLPRYFEKYMASCNQMVTQEEIGVICCAQTSSDATWLSSFTIDQNSLYEDEVFLSHNPTCCQIKTVYLAQAQDRDKNIKHIKDIIRSQKIPASTERRCETAEVRRFLYELPKLQIDPKSNILYHR